MVNWNSSEAQTPGQAECADAEKPLERELVTLEKDGYNTVYRSEVTVAHRIGAIPAGRLMTRGREGGH
ncbi:hypothetical protein GCM10010840_33970 [Deinococcus aerolatus]|uniref:Uncharacterized protein n=1 Tax=Deinococcus aerolatus TaxID=522487 RepID=A0ABQ2GFD7_9DEIO|nr:hypothetical protein GCM10010840_33970 [Deinococcus aerolatus]